MFPLASLSPHQWNYTTLQLQKTALAPAHFTAAFRFLCEPKEEIYMEGKEEQMEASYMLREKVGEDSPQPEHLGESLFP
jgi:hypothetical protein